MSAIVTIARVDEGARQQAVRGTMPVRKRMPSMSEIAVRLERIESELALRRLAHDYCIGADQRDQKRWLGVWAHDASWHVSEDRAFHGPDEILRAVQAQWEFFLQMQHGTVNHIVDLSVEDPNRATGRCDVILHAQLPDERWITGGGSYHDEYRRIDGRWRIARRTVVRPFDLAPLAPSQGPIEA